MPQAVSHDSSAILEDTSKVTLCAWDLTWYIPQDGGWEMPWAAARDRFAEAVGAGYRASYGATVIQGLQKTTLDGYLRQVRRLARMERMRPSMGARTVLETRLMDIVDGEQCESAAKLVLSAARLVEKIGWIKPVVRVADWYLVEALESRRTKEERSAAKEWAKVGDLVSLCASARSFADWEAVALACISVAHCMRRSEAGGTVGQSDNGIRFFGSKSRRGEQNQDVGPWCKEWLAFLGKLRALRGFHPHKGAWHGSGDALGKSLVELLERGGRGRGLRWHSFRRLGAAQLRKSGAPMQTVLLWGGWKSPGVAKLYTDAPPRWKFERTAEIPWPGWGVQDGRTPLYTVRKGSTMAFWPSWVRAEIAFAQSEGSRPARSGCTGGEGARKRGRTASPAGRRGAEASGQAGGTSFPSARRKVSKA